MPNLEHTADENPAIDRNFQALSGILQVLSQIPFFVGTGTPNAQVTSSPPAVYWNRSGGAGTTFYIKESGINTNTGWVGK